MNPIVLKIYDVIMEDIEKSKTGYSTLTNTEISKHFKISPFSIRDHVLKLCNDGYLQKINNYWTDDDKFHNRVLFKGKKIVSYQQMVF